MVHRMRMEDINRLSLETVEEQSEAPIDEDALDAHFEDDL